jgi:hypothetical protein
MNASDIIAADRLTDEESVAYIDLLMRDKDRWRHLAIKQLKNKTTLCLPMPSYKRKYCPCETFWGNGCAREGLALVLAVLSILRNDQRIEFDADSLKNVFGANEFCPDGTYHGITRNHRWYIHDWVTVVTRTSSFELNLEKISYAETVMRAIDNVAMQPR